MADYISREALLAEYDRTHQGPPGKARELIVNAPAADVVEARRGKWRFDDFDGDYQCPFCRIYQRKASNYCPICGADMRRGIE